MVETADGWVNVDACQWIQRLERAVVLVWSGDTMVLSGDDRRAVLDYLGRKGKKERRDGF